MRTGTAEDAFSESFRIDLDTAIAATIGDLRGLAVLEDRYLVTDWMTDRVLSFDSSGAFLGTFGRAGDGPGEFTNPRVIEPLPDGSLAVLEAAPRITRISRDLELLSTEVVEVPTFPTDLINAAGRLYLFQWASREAGDNYVEWIPGEGLGASFDRRSELVLEVPYWNTLWDGRAAASSQHLFVADNMVYPLRRYRQDLQSFDTLGTAPPSWNQATRPDRGEFASAEGQGNAQVWLRSFTIIDGLFVVGDEWLVVTHRDRVNQYRTDDLLRADVYRLEPFEKVWEDVPLPGPILEGGDCAWVVDSQPPQAWGLGCWIPMAPA